MERVAFDAGKPDLELLRQVILRRLREQPDWRTLDPDPANAYERYLQLAPPRYDDRDVLDRSILDVFWQLVIEGIVAPGISANHGGFPWFRITQHGEKVLREKSTFPTIAVGISNYCTNAFRGLTRRLSRTSARVWTRSLEAASSHRRSWWASRPSAYLTSCAKH